MLIIPAFRIVLAFWMICCLAAAFACVQASGETDYSTQYEYAIRLAGNDLTNPANLQDAITSLEQIGAYKLTKSYLMKWYSFSSVHISRPIYQLWQRTH